jgi:hypothetical protein
MKLAKPASSDPSIAQRQQLVTLHPARSLSRCLSMTAKEHTFMRTSPSRGLSRGTGLPDQTLFILELLYLEPGLWQGFGLTIPSQVFIWLEQSTGNPTLTMQMVLQAPKRHELVHQQPLVPIRTVPNQVDQVLMVQQTEH